METKVRAGISVEHDDADEKPSNRAGYSSVAKVRDCRSPLLTCSGDPSAHSRVQSNMGAMQSRHERAAAEEVRGEPTPRGPTSRGAAHAPREVGVGPSRPTAGA